MPRLLPCLLRHRAACTLHTLFPVAQHPNEKKDLCFHTAQTSVSVLPITSSAETGDAFWGRTSSTEAAMDCCDAWQVLHHLSFLWQPCGKRQQRKDCMCLSWSIYKKVLEAKLTQTGLQHRMSPLPGKAHTGPRPKAGSDHLDTWDSTAKNAKQQQLPFHKQTLSRLTAADTKRIPCPCQLFLLVLQMLRTPEHVW